MVRVREHDLKTEKDCDDEGFCLPPAKDYEVEEIIIHEGYKGHPAFVNDIGLLRLAEEIPFSGKLV